MAVLSQQWFFFFYFFFLSFLLFFFFLIKDEWLHLLHENVLHPNYCGQNFLLLTYLHFLFNSKNCLIHNCISVEQWGTEYRTNQVLIFNWVQRYCSTLWQPSSCFLIKLKVGIGYCIFLIVSQNLVLHTDFLC